MNEVNSSALSPPDTNLAPTGERFLPGQMYGDIELEHLHRYYLASTLAAGKVVMDIASGEGYGSNLLARVASRVVGVDISEEAVAHARARYPREHLEFRHGSCAAIPLASGSIDLAVSFETLEHQEGHQEMINELRRVLKPGGVLIISTPDKFEYTDRTGVQNPFHVKELYLDEFRRLLDAHFAHVLLLGQKACHGSVISPMEGRGSDFTTVLGGTEGFESRYGMASPLYFVAIASDAPLPAIPVSMLDGTEGHLVEYHKLQSDLQAAQARLLHVTHQLDGTLGSVYWRLTFPLRWLRKLVRFLFGI